MDREQPRTVDRRRANRRPTGGIAVRVRAAEGRLMPEQPALMTDVSDTGARLEFHGLEAVAACSLGDTLSVEGRIRNLARSLGYELQLFPLGREELATPVKIARIQLGAESGTSHIGVTFQKPLSSAVRKAFGLE